MERMSAKYTALRGKVVIKEEYKRLINMINNGQWEDAVTQYPFLKDYYAIEGSKLIPFSKNTINDLTNPVLSGSLYGELDLEADPSYWAEDKSYFTDLQGLEWSFITCVRDYPDRKQFNKTPIASFIDMILTKVADRIIRVEEYYQEWDYESVGYEFDKTVVNKIVGTSRYSYICNKCERPIYMCDGEC